MKNPVIHKTAVRRTVARALLASAVSGLTTFSYAQQGSVHQISATDTAVAGREFSAGPRHRFLFGNGYRNAWTAPVTVPTVSAGAHMIPVNKPSCIALPEIVKGTFLQDIAHDQVSAYQPFGAVTVPPMARAAGIYTASVQEVKAEGNSLTPFQQGGALCFLLSGSVEESKGLSTIQLLKALATSPATRVDQRAYVRARLFDMLTGDFGRYEKKVRWLPVQQPEGVRYQPGFLLSDKSYANFDGLLTRIICNALNLTRLQPYGDKIADLESLNEENTYLDRRLTNELTAQDWLDAATALQKALTNEVMGAALATMPAEVTSLYGTQILRVLEQRRDDLTTYALKYYRFLAAKTDVPGTAAAERFVVERLTDGNTRVTVFNNETSHAIEFQRTFSPKETREINIYGMGGRDVFLVQGVAKRAIVVRIIGGPQKDSLIDLSHVKGPGRKTQFYDNATSTVLASTETRAHISNVNNPYDVLQAAPDKKGFVPMAGYETLYEFYIGLGYEIKKQQWHKYPFGSDHLFGARYSLNEMSLSLLYNGTITDIVGKWNLVMNAGYDMIRDVNYFGTGNNTRLHSRHWPYYMLFTRDLYARLGLERLVDSIHDFRALLVFDRTKVVRERDHYISDPEEQANHTALDWKSFGGLEGSYELTKIDDPSFVMRGYHVLADVQWVENLASTARTVTTYELSAGAFVPLTSAFTLVLKAGAATVTGRPEFYQLTNIGGMYNLRGYQRYRFYGRTSFYNQNELRWTQDLHTYIMNGKWGLMAFYDDGRVWQPGERSNLWHTGFGGGFMLEPFNKFSFVLTYGQSKEDGVFNVHVGRYF